MFNQTVDLAKSSRTICKWPDCKQVISKGTLRFTVPGSDWPSYYHPGCLWLSFECQGRSANSRITDTSKIGNFENLPEEYKK